MAKEKKVLGAADILNFKDLKPVEVEVPEWGGSVFIRPISAAESLQFIADNERNKDKGDSAVRLMVLSVVDEDGNPLFTEGDLPKVREKSFRAIMRIQKEALKLNGLGDDKEELKDAKNA